MIYIPEDFENSGSLYCSLLDYVAVNRLIRTISRVHELPIDAGHLTASEDEPSQFVEGLFGQPSSKLKYDERCQTCVWQECFKRAAGIGPTSYVYADSCDTQGNTICNTKCHGVNATSAVVARALVGLTHLGGSKYNLSYYLVEAFPCAHCRLHAQHSNRELHSQTLPESKEAKMEHLKTIFTQLIESNADESCIARRVVEALSMFDPSQSHSTEIFSGWGDGTADAITQAATALVGMHEEKTDKRNFLDNTMPNFVNQALWFFRGTQAPVSEDTT